MLFCLFLCSFFTVIFFYFFRFLIERGNDFTIILHEYNIVLNYATKDLPSLKNNNISFGNIIIKRDTWSHISLVVSLREVSLFVNGLLVRTAVMDGILNNRGNNLRVGQSSTGKHVLTIS